MKQVLAEILGIGDLAENQVRSNLLDFLETMRGESDRGCLLVGISEIDDGLGKLLTISLGQHGTASDVKWLLDPQAGSRPLATLAVRTRMARCLGLIRDDTRQVIDALRNLRNKHAHGTKPFELKKSDTSTIFQKWSKESQEALPVLFDFKKLPMSDAKIELLESVAWARLIVQARIYMLEQGSASKAAHNS